MLLNRMESATIDEERSEQGHHEFDLGVTSGGDALNTQPEQAEQDSKEDLQKTKKGATKKRKVLSSENLRKDAANNLDQLRSRNTASKHRRTSPYATMIRQAPGHDSNIPFDKQIPRYDDDSSLLCVGRISRRAS